MGECSLINDTVTYHTPYTPIMNLLLIFILSVTIPMSSCLFFKPIAIRSTCRSDRDCPRLAASGGRCLPRVGGLCGLANIFRRNKENCNFNTCASCVNDVDCSGDSYCLVFSCVQRQTTPSTPSYYRYTPTTPSWGRGR